MRLIFLLFKSSYYFWSDIIEKFFIAFSNKPRPEVIDVEYEEVKPEFPLTYSELGRNKNKLNKNV
jgi:hypothetical protein